MPCQELVHQPGFGHRFDPHRFEVLHYDGRELIRHWFLRAWEARNCPAEHSFEPFIFSWIALNGWAACCTELDHDRQWLDALIENLHLGGAFEQLLRDEPHVERFARDFHALWPVFKAQELRRRGIMTYWHGDRRQTIEHYLREGAKSYVPECWQRHEANGEEMPRDWPHTLAALYRVRCNLFHGDKAPHSEIDRALVSNGFRTLVHFLASPRCAGMIMDH